MLEIGVYEFIKKIKWHVFSGLLLSIMILMVIQSSCVYEKSYGKYKIFAEFVDSKGILRTTYDVFVSAKGMETGLTDVKSKYVIKRGKIIGVNGDRAESGEVLLYDEDAISYFAPILLEGEWLDQYKEINNFIPCVLSENGLGLKVGDIYEMDDNNCKMVVVGIIQDGAEILGYGDIWSITDDDYEAFYRVFSHEKTRDHVVIVPKKFEQQLGELCFGDTNSGIIIYEENISDEMVDYNLSMARSTGSGIDLQDFKNNSLKKIYNELSLYLPVTLTTILSCMITIAVITLLHFRNSQETFGIYQLCGMNYKQCAILNTIPAISTCGFALLCSLIGYYAMRRLVDYNLRLYISKTQILLVIIVILIYVVIYQSVFLALYRNSSLAVKLRERRNMT